MFGFPDGARQDEPMLNPPGLKFENKLVPHTGTHGTLNWIDH